MLMQPFSVPKSAIKALYVGEITQKAEQDDEYFLRRLTTAPIDQIAKRVKERLL
jgi:hypothetical protein